MPRIITLTTEMKLGTRLNLRNTFDVGVVIGREGNGCQIERVYGQAYRKGAKAGDIITHVDCTEMKGNENVKECINKALKKVRIVV